MPTQPLISWMEKLPHVTFTNLYGPTEATIASSYFTMPAIPDDPNASVPIGQACGGEEMLILGSVAEDRAEARAQLQAAVGDFGGCAAGDYFSA